ncbi:unnamed protein product [Linum trigynum]|uniref:Uncharacterized protein n=1 Tax=Linum trigynum TaxID=586398 RepID=A0AAV2EY40_9ROSI
MTRAFNIIGRKAVLADGGVMMAGVSIDKIRAARASSRVVNVFAVKLMGLDYKPRLVVKNLRGEEQELDSVSELFETSSNDVFFENVVVVPVGNDEDDDEEEEKSSVFLHVCVV